MQTDGRLHLYDDVPFWNKYGKWIAIILLLLVLLLGWRSCSITGDRDFYRDKVTKGESALKLERDKTGALHAKMDATLTSVYELKNSQDSTIQELRKEVGNVKKLVSSIRFSGSTGGTFTGDVTNNTTLINGDTVRVQEMEYKDEWFSFKGRVVDNKYSVTPRFRNEYAVNTFWGKGGLFKEPTLQVEVISKNPYTDVTSMKPIVVPPRKKKWYETRGFMFGAGAASIMLIQTGINSAVR